MIRRYQAVAQEVRKPNGKIVLRVDAPCPCGSGKAIVACHLDTDGRLRKQRPSLRPPGPKTGYSHPRCYLRGCNDCSQQISREHYISQSILAQLGETIRGAGMPWLKPGEIFEASVGSLAANILCRRHNEALSPLDTEAGLFFSILKTALIDLNRKTLSRKPIFHLVCGDAIELWMLKVACGLYFSIGSKDGAKVANTHSIDLGKVQRAFFDGIWDARAGLYFRGSTGSRITVSYEVGMSPIVMGSNVQFGGATVSLLGFTMDLLFDSANTGSDGWSALVNRPSELVLKRKRRRHTIILTRPPGTPERAVVMEEGRPPERTDLALIL